MKTILPIFISLYLITLISYFFSETSNSKKRRAINKSILASMFFVFGVVMYFINFKSIDYTLFLMIGFLFCYLGDLILLKSFTKGGITFLIGNIFISVYEILFIVNNQIQFNNVWYAIIIFVIMFGGFFILSIKKIINLRNMYIPILLYIFFVTLHGSIAFPLAIYNCSSILVLRFIGLVLYMISDYFLMTYKFKYPWKKWVLRCNSGTYFIGLLLVAISLM